MYPCHKTREFFSEISLAGATNLRIQCNVAISILPMISRFRFDDVSWATMIARGGATPLAAIQAAKLKAAELIGLSKDIDTIEVRKSPTQLPGMRSWMLA